MKGEDTYIRSSPGGDLWLNDYSEIWLGNYISTTVVDVYSQILGQKQNEIWAYGTPEFKCKNQVGRSFFMPSNAWSFVNGYNKNLIKHYHKSLEEAVNSECRFIQFPMTTPGFYDKKKTKNPKPVHWTLMVFDTVERKWKLYNSIRPRKTTNRDDYFKNAQSVVDDAEKYWNNKVDDSYDVNHWARTIKNDILYQNTSPQQIPDSLDCAIIVMYIMGCYVAGEPIAEELSQEAVIDIKVDILSAIINNKWFWNFESYIEALKMAQIPDDEDAKDDCQIIPAQIIDIPKTK